MSLARIFEHTNPALADGFRDGTSPLLDKLAALPCLFMREGRGDEVARVGSLHRPRLVGRDVSFDVRFDPDVPPIANRLIFENRHEFEMPEEFEFSRGHWAVKDADLYRLLMRHMRPRGRTPVVFHIAEYEEVEPDLVSAMMPFDAAFADVYGSIQNAAGELELRCARADDIWEAPAIIQDIVSLIDRSRVIICDCTGRNANVFYEAGIAHALGREVILITQNDADIPFDLRHLRYIRYLNNVEGRGALTTAITRRLRTILGA